MMKNIFQKFFLYFFLIICFACQEKQTEKTPQRISRYCENELALISPPDSLPIVKIDFSKDSVEMLEDLQKQFQSDLCGEIIYCSIELRNKSRLNADIYFDKSCDINDWLEVCFYIPYTSLDLYIKNNGEIISDSNYHRKSINQDTLDTWLQKNIRVSNGVTNYGISIFWDNKTPNNVVESLLEKIKEAYLQHYKSEATKRFGLTLCDLSKEQVNILKETFPFILHIHTWNYLFTFRPNPDLIIAPEI